MRVLLVSSNRRIYSTCRQVLAGLANTRFELTVVPTSPPADRDLYIWDYESDPSLRGSEKVAGRVNIFLVEKENLSALRSHFDTPPVWTLLKPVNPQLLENLISDPAIMQKSPVLQIEDRASAAHQEDLLEALLETNLLLQQADQARNDLFAQGSRELRMPLMATLGYCRLLLDQQLGQLNADQAKVIQRMQHSAQRLLRVATSMFQSTTTERGPMQPRFQNGNFTECLDRAIVEITPMLEARGLTIHRKIVPPRPGFAFDPELVTQLLADLLDHAARCAPRGGEIRVRTQPVFWDRRATNLSEGRVGVERRARRMQEPNAYRIEVQDPGLASQRSGADAGIPATPHGTDEFGFGFSVCKQIIELHRGRIVSGESGPGYFACEIPYAQEPESERRELRAFSGEATRVRAS